MVCTKELQNDLEHILYVYPEIRDNPEHWTMLRGVLQFSDIKAMGFAWWHKDSYEEIRIIKAKPGFILNMPKIRQGINTARQKYDKPIDACLWVISKPRGFNSLDLSIYTAE